MATSAAPERHVELEGQHNFRDVGGYEAADGRTVKWGQIYRSGQLPDLSDADVEQLDSLGIRTVITFLVPKEIENYGEDRVPESTRQVYLPITGELAEELSLQAGMAIRTGDFSALPADLNPEVHRLLLEDAREEYAAVLRTAADPTNRPLVYHCSHGVHRTGTATAILLSALGVPWETVRQDYLLSNVYRADEVEAELARIRSKVASDRGISPEEVDMTNVEAFYYLEGHYIDSTLEKAVEDYGSMEAYIRDGLGISDEEIEHLRAELLESPS
ncbi:MAG: tyrosine-protein phosphatase [Gemmatimonadetes bacterium]|nr:tyrosine-protein phosphatase [Gemmatimonadota bacterium]